jgi:hypothetical protein
MDQDEIDFDRPAADGVEAWHRQRSAQSRQLSQDVGLPIGHRVRLELRDGSGMEGRLELAENLLFIEPTRRAQLRLRIDRCEFLARDIASCVRLEDPSHA